MSPSIDMFVTSSFWDDEERDALVPQLHGALMPPVTAQLSETGDQTLPPSPLATPTVSTSAGAYGYSLASAALMHSHREPCFFAFVPVCELLCKGCREKLCGLMQATAEQEQPCQSAPPVAPAVATVLHEAGADLAPAVTPLSVAEEPMAEKLDKAAADRKKAARRREQRRRRRCGLPLRFPARRVQAELKPRVKGRFVR